MSKLRLDLDALAVEAFETDSGMAGGAGTVDGFAKPDDVHREAVFACTQEASCYCRTAYAVCGTGHATIYSCVATSPAACA
jgi:hypothetical protein